MYVSEGVFENGLVFRKQIETALHSGFESTLLKQDRQDVMRSKRTREIYLKMETKIRIMISLRIPD